MRGVGCWMASFASISDGFVNFVRRPSVCAQPPKRKQSFVNKFTLKLAHNKLFLYWWVLFFSFFCFDAKEPKDQAGKSLAKKLYFFLKIPELERLFGFSFICWIYSLFKQRNFLNEKNIVFLYACGFLGQGFVNFVRRFFDRCWVTDVGSCK